MKKKYSCKTNNRLHISHNLKLYNVVLRKCNFIVLRNLHKCVLMQYIKDTAGKMTNICT